MAEVGDRPGGNGPWGNSFIVQTPNLDRVSQQINQQNADRKAYLEKEGQQTNELLNKELANVRSVDMGDVSDAYNKWKQLSQPLYFNKGLQNNPKKYNQAQMEANAALGDVRAKINQSAQLNQFGKQMSANRLSKPDAYDDNAGSMISGLYNTPMSQVRNYNLNGKTIDLTDPENYRYKGGNYDYSKLHAAATGKPVTHYDDGTTDASGIQTTQHGYQYGNTPSTYRDIYMGGLASNEANRGARASWTQHSPEELDQLDAAYQNSPNWQKLGKTPDQLPAYNPSDPVGNEATYQAKKYLVGMNPSEAKAAVVTNRDALLNQQQHNRLQMEAVKQVNRSALKAQSYANSKSLFDYKLKQTNPEGTTPTVSNMQDLLEHPGETHAGKTNVQLAQDVYSSWNSQGNNEHQQSSLTVIPTFNPSQPTKGFEDFQQGANRAVETAYKATLGDKGNWSAVVAKLNSATPEQRVQLLAETYNAINLASGSTVRFTAEDLTKSVPVLHKKTEVTKDGSVTGYQMLKPGTPAFEDVTNEKRNATLSAKKPVIQGQENKNPGAPATTSTEVKIGNSGIKWQ